MGIMVHNTKTATMTAETTVTLLFILIMAFYPLAFLAFRYPALTSRIHIRVISDSAMA